MGKISDSGREPRPDVICLEGNGYRPSHRGDGWAVGGAMFTLNSTEVHAVCYGIDLQGGKGNANYTVNVSPTILSDSHGTPNAVCYGLCSFDSNAMKSSNPHSGIYVADTSRTLDLNGGNPACNQGGVLVLECYAVDCRNGTENECVNGTLQAKPNGGFSLNCNTVVRTKS